MTTITLEVPDDLAAQFKLDQIALSALLRESLTTTLNKRKDRAKAIIGKTLSQEVVEFLSSTPSLEQIVKFKISKPAQERLQELLEKNREAQLTAQEQSELDQYLQYRHALILLKASARRAIASRP